MDGDGGPDHHAHRHPTTGGAGDGAGGDAHGGHSAAVAGGGPHAGHGAQAHAGHQGHGAMVADFRRRFWVSLVLSVPVLALAPMIQRALGLRDLLSFPGDSYFQAALATTVFLYGGRPFLSGFVDELRRRRPGMMTLIALAVGVAWGYSVLVVLGVSGQVFFWELVTLIDVMLLGHWMEMRSVMGASRALEELVRLMPAEAHRLGAGGAVEGRSAVDQALLTGDAEAVARSVAAELGLDDYFAEVLPHEKAAKVEQVKARGLTVAMIGDGVNDAPALVAADVGIALGAVLMSLSTVIVAINARLLKI